MIEQQHRLSQLIEGCASILANSSSTPRLDAELLAASVLGHSRAMLIASLPESIPPEKAELIKTLVVRRARGEPVAYILGKQEFWGLEFEVNPDVLIPRPETELLVETCLRHAGDFTSPLTILDLGTGSGCISIALAHELKKDKVNTKVYAVEKSVEALAVAKRNASKHQLISEIKFINADWSKAVDSGFATDENGPFHIAICNPPYVDPHSEIDRSIMFEPASALFSPEGGLSDISKVIAVARNSLAPKGLFICEIGFRQKKGVASLFDLPQNRAAWSDVKFLEDLAGIPRVAVAKRESVQFQ